MGCLLLACAQENVDRKVAIDGGMVTERAENIRGSIMIAYPMGLPPYDPLTRILEGVEALEESSVRPW